MKSLIRILIGLILGIAITPFFIVRKVNFEATPYLIGFAASLVIFVLLFVLYKSIRSRFLAKAKSYAFDIDHIADSLASGKDRSTIIKESKGFIIGALRNGFEFYRFLVVLPIIAVMIGWVYSLISINIQHQKIATVVEQNKLLGKELVHHSISNVIIMRSFGTPR